MIKIKTRFDDSVAGVGGKTVTYYAWKTGPRNLLRAVRELREHSAAMTMGYGNYGHLGSWIEIDGYPLTQRDIDEYKYQTESERIAPMAASRRLIAKYRAL